MTIRAAFEAGRRALREARAEVGESFDAASFGAGALAMANWASPRRFDESIFDTEALLMFVGKPTGGDDGQFLLDASVGPAPLTPTQKQVVDEIIAAGAWTSVADFSRHRRPVVLKMLNLGLLYAMSEDDGGFYRDDLVPVRRPQAGGPLRRVDDRDNASSMVIQTPRGPSGQSEFPLLSLSVWNAVDGERTANEVVRDTLEALKGPELTELIADTSHPGRGADATIDVLRALFRAGIGSLTQAGFFWLDIR